MTRTVVAVDPVVIVALDHFNADEALRFSTTISPTSCRLKVGFELFASGGPAVVEALVARGFGVFLDLKFHDIPNTVARACAVAAKLGVWMVNVHALGGRRMMSAAREAIAREPHAPLLVAVTVLTSHSVDDLQEFGLGGPPELEVQRLANLAMAAGLDGVVCSAREAALLRREHGHGIRLVTPGIRPAGSATNDQQRVVTPVDARRAGADYLVIGRPITQAGDPVAVLAAINREIAGS